MTTQRRVGILIFDEVEVLDFAGPFEVFAVCGSPAEERHFQVVTVSRDGKTISARNGLSVNPHHSFENCPPLDLLVVPGGRGVRPIVNQPDEATIAWVAAQAQSTEMVLSVCTGAWVLAKAGVLDGLEATTYHDSFERLQELAPSATLRPGLRWVDNGRIITSAGVSAGIDAALHTVRRLLGAEVADATAAYMEYEHWARVR